MNYDATDIKVLTEATSSWFRKGYDVAYRWSFENGRSIVIQHVKLPIYGDSGAAREKWKNLHADYAVRDARAMMSHFYPSATLMVIGTHSADDENEPRVALVWIVSDILDVLKKVEVADERAG